MVTLWQVASFSLYLTIIHTSLGREPRLFECSNRAIIHDREHVTPDLTSGSSTKRTTENLRSVSSTERNSSLVTEWIKSIADTTSISSTQTLPQQTGTVSISDHKSTTMTDREHVTSDFTSGSAIEETTDKLVSVSLTEQNSSLVTEWIKSTADATPTSMTQTSPHQSGTVSISDHKITTMADREHVTSDLTSGSSTKETTENLGLVSSTEQNISLVTEWIKISADATSISSTQTLPQQTGTVSISDHKSTTMAVIKSTTDSTSMSSTQTSSQQTRSVSIIDQQSQTMTASSEWTKTTTNSLFSTPISPQQTGTLSTIDYESPKLSDPASISSTQAMLQNSATASPTDQQSSTGSDTTESKAQSTSPHQVREECYQYLYYATSLPVDGVYIIQNSFGTFPVYCNLLEDGGGWTVIQRRIDDSISFDRDWTAYQDGFGDLSSNFWLGLDKIGSICSARDCELFVVMTDWEDRRGTSYYGGFSVEGTNLFISNFISGNAGNSLTIGVPVQFSTYDSDNDSSGVNCASVHGGGWWYTDCGDSSPNGFYYPSPDNLHSDGIVWKSWQGDSYSLKSFELRIRNSGNI